MCMKSRVQDKIQAIALRMQGYSYSQIKEQLGVSKSLLSGWLKYVNLNQEQEKALVSNLEQRSKRGVARAVITNIAKRKDREIEAKEKASSLYQRYKEDRMYIAGLCLYWAEGSKRSSGAQFVNSDSNMVVFMIWWFEKYLGFSRETMALRLSTHRDFIDENYELFWSEKTKIPLEQFKKTTYKPNRHGVYKKNPLYKGCVRLEVPGGMDTLRTMIYMYESFISESEMLYSGL